MILRCWKFRSLKTPWVVTIAFVLQHDGQPYCHKPCYAVLFGPKGKKSGTRLALHRALGSGVGWCLERVTVLEPPCPQSSVCKRKLTGGRSRSRYFYKSCTKILGWYWPKIFLPTFDFSTQLFHYVNFWIYLSKMLCFLQCLLSAAISLYSRKISGLLVLVPCFRGLV